MIKQIDDNLAVNPADVALVQRKEGQKEDGEPTFILWIYLKNQSQPVIHAFDDYAACYLAWCQIIAADRPAEAEGADAC
jgi:hypothetical protein